MKKRQNKAQMECDNFMEENELGKYQTIPLENVRLKVDFKL
jgi:hypothetical protein